MDEKMAYAAAIRTQILEGVSMLGSLVNDLEIPYENTRNHVKNRWIQYRKLPPISGTR